MTFVVNWVISCSSQCQAWSCWWLPAVMVSDVSCWTVDICYGDV